jgi:hypothetical protein
MSHWHLVFNLFLIDCSIAASFKLQFYHIQETWTSLSKLWISSSFWDHRPYALTYYFFSVKTRIWLKV